MRSFGFQGHGIQLGGGSRFSHHLAFEENVRFKVGASSVLECQIQPCTDTAAAERRCSTACSVHRLSNLPHTALLQPLSTLESPKMALCGCPPESAQHSWSPKSHEESIQNLTSSHSGSASGYVHTVTALQTQTPQSPSLSPEAETPSRGRLQLGQCYVRERRRREAL